MKKPLLILAFAASLLCGACSFAPDHPGEEEVKAILAGRYCSEDLRHRMELGHDGRYAGHRIRAQRQKFESVYQVQGQRSHGLGG